MVRGIMGISSTVKALTAKIPAEAYYIVALFIVTRVILEFIGVFSRLFVTGGTYFNLSPRLPLSIWGVWDSGWYLSIAKSGYTITNIPNGQSPFAFFPLYPLLVNILGSAIGDLFSAGLIISNVCLLVACYFLYKLVSMEYGRETALGSVKYLFLFPTAFIFSGFFTESLFLMLAVMSFYYAKRQNWLYVGALGFFLSISRPQGIFTLLPLLYEYFRQREFKLESLRPDILFLALLPAGLAAYALFNYHMTGDLLAFYHVESSWGRSLANPVQSLLNGFSWQFIDSMFLAAFTVVPLALVTAYIKKIGFSYWLFSAVIIVLPVLTGNLQSSERYAIIAFPIFLVLAMIGKDKTMDQWMMIALALLQGFLMVLWTTGIGIMA